MLLQGREPLHHLRYECRAAIGCGFLDQAFQRVADVLGRVDHSEDSVLEFVFLIAIHRAPSLASTRLINMSLKSIPTGGRAIRTRRPSRRHRNPHSRAAASPDWSPSASTITS